ncbi:putative alpha,alpha-trehalose-phosphate synthase (UDP-forming) [Helianthus annuus]|nr:putative alpha,alpha-trehalose-phosphate synthase (UDP-forming) [Helianthus annuus]KAJ0564350.1 putative alpha,alpha-trehalose-phosphate synthase (UDP-forming) [Helianthus annuus]KAJ0729679.1 putative alpha,alpha-trehalose-phosphate synthase (UDP-forming) [Helianthus annuus]KAJ0732415.1 putative alpha,alpha-trehalose-phosphate synthase (UDP-forming) [Helianthus annuus]
MWPLFHSRGLPQEDGLDAYVNFQSQFNAYIKANQMFADVIEENYQEGDVWCHDYHLLFLLRLLKEKRPNMRVGWFLHTPFPSSETYRIMSSRSHLLTAVLIADLVGACTHILGLQGTLVGVQDQGRVTRIAAYPIGIDSQRFVQTVQLLDVQNPIKELEGRFGGKKIAMPTRTEVSMYKKLARHVHEIVGQISGRFGTPTLVLVHFLDQLLDFNTLCTLYTVAYVALITSVIDGMNLVSYEFVACQASKKGVLVLSEFVGATQSLGAGAILVNPWNITDVASSILYVLDMPSEEKEKRHNHNFMHVITHTCQKWPETFLSELDDTVAEAQLRTKQIPPQLQTELAVNRYRCSSNRMFILNFEDYNVWLAVEHGVFIRTADKNGSQNLTNNIHTDWIASVKVSNWSNGSDDPLFFLKFSNLLLKLDAGCNMFSSISLRELHGLTVSSTRRQSVGVISVQVCLLNLLRTGPISNASVDIVQGERSVEIRVNGVSKGVGIHDILGQVIRDIDMKLLIDYVLCVGHFFPKVMS